VFASVFNVVCLYVWDYEYLASIHWPFQCAVSCISWSFK